MIYPFQLRGFLTPLKLLKQSPGKDARAVFYENVLFIEF